MVTPSKPVLISSRLRLRAVVEGDAEELVLLDADPEVRKFVDQPSPPTLEDVRRSVIPRWQSYDQNTPALGFWVADQNGKFAGWFHLRPPKEGYIGLPSDLELGYRLRRDCWGQGLATEGGHLLVQYAFVQLNAPRVTATALQANVASIQVMRKLGMSLAADWLYKDHTPAVLYSITAAHWQSLRQP